jgi:hypothetical protein
MGTNSSGYGNVSLRRTLTGADVFNQTITPISSSKGFITTLYVIFTNNTQGVTIGHIINISSSQSSEPNSNTNVLISAPQPAI